MSQETPNHQTATPQDGAPPSGAAPTPLVGEVPPRPQAPGPTAHPAPQYAPTGKRSSVLGAWGARIVLIVVAACALVSVVFILFGAGGDTLGRVVTTDIALIVFALLVWLDTVIGAYRPEWFEFASLATDAYLLLLWIVTIWTENGSGPFALWIDIWRSILCLIFVRGMLALVDLVRFLYARWVTAVTRVLAYVSGCAFGVIGIMVTIPAPTPFNQLWDLDFYGRVVASVAVIAGVALVLIPLWGLLINRGHRPPRTGSYGFVRGAYGDGAYGNGAYGNGAYGPGIPPVPQAPGYPRGSAPVPPVLQAPIASPVPQAPIASPVPQAPAVPLVPQAHGASSAPQASAHAEHPSAAAHPPLAWPRLANGAPVPAGAAGAPDFAAVAGAPLAWPTFSDGSPVPAAHDGSPLYR
ncbi:hypothetical protein GCM10028798_36430 [Humibacter antri]